MVNRTIALLFQRDLLDQYFSIIIVKMRKFLKSKDQTQNSSNVFKQAKRRFHYEPSHKENKYFLHSKHKHQSVNQFKDDFSSVKQMKADNNQINQSSWIVKLVNVMHQNSEEDTKPQAQPQSSSNFLNLQPIQSKEIIQDFQKASKTPPLPTLKEQSSEVTPVATKKNSFNVDMFHNKKQSKSQKSQSCDTVSRRSKKHSRADTIKRTKNEVEIKRNRSQSQLKQPKAKEENTNPQMRSLKSISCSKATTDKIKNQCPSILSEHNFQSSKHYSALQSKNSLQINKNAIESIKETLPVSNIRVEEQRGDENNYKSSFCYVPQSDNILTEQIPEDLFAVSTNHKSNMKNDSQTTTQKRAYVGSIKKNKIYGSEQKNIFATNLEERKPVEKVVIRQASAVIIEKKDQDIITAREQQHLIDKYLNNDYSFKKQSNMSKYDYATSEFDRSLMHLNKPAISLDRSLNSGKTTAHHQSRRQSHLDKIEQKANSKRENYKKFNYFSENAQKQTTQNSLSVEILTLRCQQDQKPQEYYEVPSFSKQFKCEKYQYIPRERQYTQFRSANEDDLKRIHQKYNRYNRQNDKKAQLKNLHSLHTNITKRENLSELKSNTIINRNPYLQQSLYKQDTQVITLDSNCEYPTFKFETKDRPFPRKRVQSSFNIENLNSISRRQKNDSELFSEAESDQMITRLNSKLNNYIHQYHLEKENERPLSSRQNEPTHRRMNLDFNELKKHHDYFQK